MRHVRIVALVCMLGLAPVWAAGQVIAVRSNNDPVSVLSPESLSAAQKEVLAADANWARAYQTCDMVLMDAVLHDDILFIHAHARVDTKPLLMKQFGTCANEETIIQPLRVVVIGADTAVLEAGMRLRQKGQTEFIQSLITRVYARQGGSWRLIAHQTTRNPGVDASGQPLPNPAMQPTR